MHYFLKATISISPNIEASGEKCAQFVTVPD